MVVSKERASVPRCVKASVGRLVVARADEQADDEQEEPAHGKLLREKVGEENDGTRCPAGGDRRQDFLLSCHKNQPRMAVTRPLRYGTGSLLGESCGVLDWARGISLRHGPPVKRRTCFGRPTGRALR